MRWNGAAAAAKWRHRVTHTQTKTEGEKSQFPYGFRTDFHRILLRRRTCITFSKTRQHQATALSRITRGRRGVGSYQVGVLALSCDFSNPPDTLAHLAWHCGDGKGTRRCGQHAIFNIEQDHSRVRILFFHGASQNAGQSSQKW